MQTHCRSGKLDHKSLTWFRRVGHMAEECPTERLCGSNVRAKLKAADGYLGDWMGDERTCSIWIMQPTHVDGRYQRWEHLMDSTKR